MALLKLACVAGTTRAQSAVSTARALVFEMGIITPWLVDRFEDKDARSGGERRAGVGGGERHVVHVRRRPRADDIQQRNKRSKRKQTRGHIGRLDVQQCDEPAQSVAHPAALRHMEE